MKQTFRKGIAASRYLVIVGAMGAFFASLAALLYGSIMLVVAVKDQFSGDLFTIRMMRLFAADLIDIIDLLLLGVVLYIVAIGLYKLFIDEDIDMPAWMVFEDLDDIKAKIITVVVVLLAVEFLGFVVQYEGKDLLRLGGSIGIVLVAIAFFMYVMKMGGSGAQHKPRPTGPEDKPVVSDEEAG